MSGAGTLGMCWWGGDRSKRSLLNGTATSLCWRHWLWRRKHVLPPLICLLAQETLPLTLYFNGFLSTAPKLNHVAKIFVSRAKCASGLCVIPGVRASRGADLITNHLHLMIIVYVHTVPPSQWLHQGLVSHSGEVSGTQISTQSLQSHMGAPWIFYLSNQDLCHEFVCTIPAVRDGCLSLLPFVPAGGRGCCGSISQTDRQTDRDSLVPQQQWEPNTHSSTSAVLQSSASLSSYHCYHLVLGPPAYKPHVVLVWATIDCD